MIQANDLRSSHSGAVLVIVLIMVGIFMIIVTSLVATSNINFRIAGNQQYRMEAKVAARNALEAYLSNDANFISPPLASITYPFNFNGDTQNGEDVYDMSATVAPAVCTLSQPISQVLLVLTDPDDAQCAGGVQKNQGIIGASGPASSSASWCSNMNWQVTSAVDDQATNVALAMIQGIAVRAATGTPCPS